MISIIAVIAIANFTIKFISFNLSIVAIVVIIGTDCTTIKNSMSKIAITPYSGF